MLDRPGILADGDLPGAVETWTADDPTSWRGVARGAWTRRWISAQGWQDVYPRGRVEVADRGVAGVHGHEQLGLEPP